MMPTSPTAALVRREFITQLRGARAFLLLALFVGLCTVVVAWNWPEQERVFRRAADLSREMVMMISFMLMGACFLFVPALGATAILVEREQDTFDMLRTTLVRPSGMVLAKLLNTVGFYLMMFIGTVPVIATSFFLLGLAWIEVAQILAVLLVTAASCALSGLLCSALIRKPLVAVSAAYGLSILGLGSNVLVRIPVLFVVLLTGNMWFARTNPFMWSSAGAIFGILEGGFGATDMAMVILYQCLFGLLCFGLTLGALRREPRAPQVESFRPIDDPAILRRRRTTWPFYLVDPLARKKPVEDNRNAMLVRELRWGVTSRGALLLRIFFAAFIVYFFSAVPVAFDRDMSAGSGWFAFQMVVVIVLAPTVLANTFTKEFELGNMDNLRMTLLTSREVATGKVVAGLVNLSPLLMAGLCSYLPFLVLKAFWPGTFFAGFTTLVLCAVLSVAIAFRAAVISRKSNITLIVSYLMGLVVFGWTVVIRFLLATYYTLDKADQSLLNKVLRYVDSPPLSFFYGARNIKDSAFTAPWAANIMLYSALAGFLFWGAYRAFAREGAQDQ